jgi:DNA-binding transcriptional ArsR family regulator
VLNLDLDSLDKGGNPSLLIAIMKPETKGLSPTLWRTCRVLSGQTRIRLFRRIIHNPGLCVFELAKAEAISLPRASQELRRLQSRGLVQVEREGRHVRYYPESDPLVASAKPLLLAMRITCERFAEKGDGQTAKVAMGLGHAKRLEIVRVLREEPLGPEALQSRLRMPSRTLSHHVEFLQNGNWIEWIGQTWKLAANEHPLAQCLLKML